MKKYVKMLVLSLLLFGALPVINNLDASEINEKAVATFNLSFDANGRTGEMAVLNPIADEMFALPESGFVAPKGKVFDRWGTSTVATEGFTFEAGEEVMPDFLLPEVKDLIGPAKAATELKLYALYVAAPVSNEYAVSFDANGGEGTMESQTMTVNVAKKINMNKFTKAGHTFLNWNTKADGTGNSVANGETMIRDTNANVSLYAEWEKIEVPTNNAPVITLKANSITLERGVKPDMASYFTVTDDENDTVQLAYSFDVVKGRALAEFEFDVNKLNNHILFMPVGNYFVDLTATDKAGLTTTERIDIKIVDSEVTPPVVDPETPVTPPTVNPETPIAPVKPVTPEGTVVKPQISTDKLENTGVTSTLLTYVVLVAAVGLTLVGKKALNK